MGIQRGQKLTKLSLEQLKNIVQQRDHTLLKADTSLKNHNHVPKQNRIFLRCNKCNFEWNTKVYVYLERQSLSLGCRQCYENNIQDPNLYPNSPLRKKETNTCNKSVASKPTRKADRQALNTAFVNGAYGHIKNVKDLIYYLKENPNAYNDKVLELVLRNEGLKKQKIKSYFKNITPCNTNT